MNSKHHKILEDIFFRPTKQNISWSEIEKLMLALNAKIREGKGSAGVFILNNSVFPFHRPHPQKEAKKYQIDDLRKFLTAQGITNAK